MGGTWLGAKVDPDQMRSESIRFVLETFLEILISPLLIFNYTETSDLKFADKFSMSLQIGGLISCIYYVIYITWFTRAKGPQFAAERLDEVSDWYEQYQIYKIAMAYFENPKAKENQDAVCHNKLSGEKPCDIVP